MTEDYTTRASVTGEGATGISPDNLMVPGAVPPPRSPIDWRPAQRRERLEVYLLLMIALYGAILWTSTIVVFTIRFGGLDDWMGVVARCVIVALCLAVWPLVQTWRSLWKGITTTKHDAFWKEGRL